MKKAANDLDRLRIRLLTVSKAFMKSMQIILPSRLYLSENSMTSSIVLTVSKIVFPLTYASNNERF